MHRYVWHDPEVAAAEAEAAKAAAAARGQEGKGEKGKIQLQRAGWACMRACPLDHRACPLPRLTPCHHNLIVLASPMHHRIGCGRPAELQRAPDAGLRGAQRAVRHEGGQSLLCVGH